MDKVIELKPCPFCGTIPTRRNGIPTTQAVPKDYAYCETGTCPIKRVPIYLDEWNARAAGEWVRIEDGLPEESGSYLITFRWKDEGPFLYVAEMYYEEGYWDDPSETPSKREIVAWKRLDDPYTEPLTEQTGG